MGWIRRYTLPIGGVTEVGFDDLGNMLFVVSHSGRGIFSARAGEKIARDYDTTYKWHHDTFVEGFGPLAGEKIRVYGLHSIVTPRIEEQLRKHDFYIENHVTQLIGAVLDQTGALLAIAFSDGVHVYEKEVRFDLFGAAFKREPFATFARMRQEVPVYGHRAPNGETVWYITRYDDAVAVLKDNDHFCKDVRRTKSPPLASQKLSVHQRINDNMLFSDPPDHTRLRALVSQAFTPRRVEQMRPRIQAIAEELLDGLVGETAVDLIAQFALPLPVRVIGDLLGIPAADQADVSEWSQAIIAPGSRGLRYKERRQLMQRFVAYLQALFAARRQSPQDDLISDLVQAEQAGQRLSEAELSSMVALLLVTGHETTVNLIGNGALALLRHPKQLALLQADAGMWATAVEELLRFDGPVETSTTRWVCRDVVLGGQQLTRGDVVRVVLSSANRDAAHFEQPNVLDVARAENKHLAFGLGIHYCLGAALARWEGVIGLQSLFARFPKLALAVPTDALVWRPGVLFRGLAALPVFCG